MRLDKIRLVNYRCYADTTIEFTPQFNVLIGANGSGKTSLLRAICESFYGFAADFHATAEMPISLDAVRSERIEASGRVRFEARYPVLVTADVSYKDTALSWTVKRTSGATQAQLDGTVPMDLWSMFSDPSGSWRGIPTDEVLPILAFYRAHRQWSQESPDVLVAARVKNSRLDAYNNYCDASSDANALQEWTIVKCLERFQTSSESGVAFDDINDDELALVNRALATAVPEIEGIKYDMREKSLLVEWKASGRESSRFSIFSNLSDGQRAIVGLVADIARRICLLNPHLGNDVVDKTPGIVLIDELDIHLHPKWQRALAIGLQRAFPSVQFIVATHSPQVLSEMQPEQIIVLGGESVVHPQVSYGLESSAVLEEIMDAPKRPESVSSALSSLFDALERNDLQASRDQLDALQKVAPGIPELIRAEAMLKRKEVIGR